MRGLASKRLPIAVAAVLLAAVAVPLLATAHIERPSYWPNPAANRSIHPATGGKVPKARSLASALDRSRRGQTRVVCKSNSLSLLQHSIDAARRHGYDIRPHDHRRLSDRRAARLAKVNRQLGHRCAFHDIQPGHLHRARIARQAHGRSQVRQVRDHERPRRCRRALLRVPVPLPERSEPDCRARKEASEEGSSGSSEVGPSRDPGRWAMHPLQLPDRGLGRERR